MTADREKSVCRHNYYDRERTVLMEEKKKSYAQRTFFLNVRLTQQEHEQLMNQLEDYCIRYGNIKKCDFVRKKLVKENYQEQLKSIMFELRKIRTDLWQAKTILEKNRDEKSEKYFSEVLVNATEKLDRIAEEISNLKNNFNQEE